MRLTFHQLQGGLWFFTGYNASTGTCSHWRWLDFVGTRFLGTHAIAMIFSFMSGFKMTQLTCNMINSLAKRKADWKQETRTRMLLTVLIRTSFCRFYDLSSALTQLFSINKMFFSVQTRYRPSSPYNRDGCDGHRPWQSPSIAAVPIPLAQLLCAKAIMHKHGSSNKMYL